MKYEIYVGVILYFCPALPKDHFETMVFVACDEKEATAKTEKHAIEHARTIKLVYKNFKVMVQAQRTNRVADCVHFVRTGFLENEVQTIENEREFLM